jgi:hypothetical protein
MDDPSTYYTPLRMSRPWTPGPAAAGGGGPVAFDSSAQALENGGDGILTLSYTCSGSNRGLFVGVCARGFSGSSTSTTYDGDAMQEVWDVGSGLNNSGYVIAVEAVGTGALNIVNTLSDAPGSHALVAASFTGVNQTTPAGTATTATGGASPATVTVADVGADDMVVDTMYIQSAGSKTAGADQIVLQSVDMTNSVFLYSSYQDGVDGGVMSWTLGGTPDIWHNGAVALKPA